MRERGSRCHSRSLTIRLLILFVAILCGTITNAVPAPTHDSSTSDARASVRQWRVVGAYTKLVNALDKLPILLRAQSDEEETPQKVNEGEGKGNGGKNSSANQQELSQDTNVTSSKPNVQKPKGASDATDSQKKNDGGEKQSKSDSESSAQTGQSKRSGQGQSGKSKQSGQPEQTKETKDKGKATDKTEGEEGGDAEEESSSTPEADVGRSMSASEMIAEARAKSKGILKGGFIEFIEWLFVFILVAPGTFPAIGCIILSCASFWRRRLGATPSSPSQGAAVSSGTRVPGNQGATYQRVPLSDHGALVARTRVKGSPDERDSEFK